MEMKSMQAVSRTWQAGFELAVKGIVILDLAQHPGLPYGLETGRRFPLLTKLDLGKSRTSTSSLETLQTFTRLNSLILGDTGAYAHIHSLARWLTDADMVHLWV